MLPEPRNKRGYTGEEIERICRKKNIDPDDFWEAFGINTCSMDENGDTIFYTCDVEKALYLLKDIDGEFHEWD